MSPALSHENYNNTLKTLSVNVSWFSHKYHFNITMQQRTCKTGLGDDQYIDVELEF